jgi:hypothetical protein
MNFHMCLDSHGPTLVPNTQCTTQYLSASISELPCTALYLPDIAFYSNLLVLSSPTRVGVRFCLDPLPALAINKCFLR